MYRILRAWSVHADHNVENARAAIVTLYLLQAIYTQVLIRLLAASQCPGYKVETYHCFIVIRREFLMRGLTCTSKMTLLLSVYAAIAMAATTAMAQSQWDWCSRDVTVRRTGPHCTSYLIETDLLLIV